MSLTKRWWWCGFGKVALSPVMHKWDHGMTKLAQSNLYMSKAFHKQLLVLNVLSWHSYGCALVLGSYLGSSHSSVHADTPTHCNDQAILILKVSWVSIQPNFECTNTPLPTCLCSMLHVPLKGIKVRFVGEREGGRTQQNNPSTIPYLKRSPSPKQIIFWQQKRMDTAQEKVIEGFFFYS